MSWDLPEIADRVNASDDRRVVIAKPEPEIITENDRTARETARYAADRAQWAWRKNGALSTVKNVASIARDKVVKT